MREKERQFCSKGYGSENMRIRTHFKDGSRPAVQKYFCGREVSLQITDEDNFIAYSHQKLRKNGREDYYMMDENVHFRCNKIESEGS